MTLYIGVDIHARQQTLSYLDTEDGMTDQVVLDHEVDDVAGFYRKLQGEVIIGIEGCGYTNWFEEGDCSAIFLFHYTQKASRQN
jgi:hypothetical protein